MIEIDRFYNAALANPTTTAEDFREQADAAKNPQRVRRTGSTDERERDASRAPREALNASISGVRQQSLPQTEVQAIKTKLGVGNVTRENSGRPLETRTVREAGNGFDEGNFDDVIDREVDALLKAILSLNAVTTPGQETPGDFMSTHKTPMGGVTLPHETPGDFTSTHKTPMDGVTLPHETPGDFMSTQKTLPGGVTPGQETPGDFTPIKTLEDFRTAVGNTIRDIGSSIKQAYRETPPEGRTPEIRNRSIEALRKAGAIGREQLQKAFRADADFNLLFTELLGLISSVAAGVAILSAVATVLKIAQAFLEAKWTAESAETELMARETKARLEEMLEKIKQIVEDLKLKLKLLMARAEDKQSLHEGRRVGGFRAPAAAATLQLSSAMLVMRRLEDVEKLVAGYERRMKERHVAGDSVKVM